MSGAAALRRPSIVAVTGQAGCIFVSRVGGRAPSSSKNVGPSLRACKMLRISRSLSRTNNVFLTKMDALLPVTNYEYSLPDLLLLVKAGTDITFIKNLIPP